MYKTIFTSIVFLFLLLSISIAKPPTYNDCFSNFKFTNEYFENFYTIKNVYDSNEVVTGFVKLRNVNNYSLPNLDILANVWYVGDSFIDRPEGNDLIDEFFVARDVNLLPLASQTLFFKWQPPAKIKSGTYFVSLYLIEGKQIALAGISALPELAGASTTFTVNNSNAENLFRFDKNSIKTYDWVLNPNPQIRVLKYQQRSPTPSYTLPLNISFILVNEGEESDFRISYKLYRSFDNYYEENLVSEKNVTIHLAKNESKQLNYSTNKLPTNSYHFIAIAEKDGQKSMLKVRVQMFDKIPGFTFLGLEKFPLKKSEDVKIFWCYANVVDMLFDTEQTIEIIDENNKLVERFEFDNVTTSAVRRGAEVIFTPPKDLNKFSLVGKIFDESGNLQNAVQLDYDSEKFKLTSEEERQTIIPVLISILIISLLLIFFLRWKFRR